MDRVTRDRLVRYRDTARKATSPQASEPPSDSRPRFARGPLAGKLKDPRERAEEELGLDDPEADEWLPEALKDRAWAEAYSRYERLYGEQVAAEKLAARSEADIATTAKHLGLSVERFKELQGDPAKAGELLAREHNAKIAEEIARLDASRRDVPEPPEAPAA